MNNIQNNKSFMKKKLFAVVGLCVLCLSSCGTDKNVETEAEKIVEAVESNEVKTTETMICETVSFERIYEDNLEFAVIKGIDSNNNVVWEYCC